MSDRYIEKTFLYLILLSVTLHAVLFLVIVNLPQEKKAIRQEPYMVELQDMPAKREEPAREKKEVRRLDQERRRVARETAPKGEMPSERHTYLPRPAAPALPQPAPLPQSGREAAPPRVAEKGGAPVKEKSGAADFFRQKGRNLPDISKLFPSADKLAKLEEDYRKKYGPEVEEGDTKFLNSDDIQFGSFLRRFESAVYGVWRYPPEAVRMGIEGVTPVRVTFNRNGEIEKVEVLESSGSRILDEEVRRTLKVIGPIGGFPKAYGKDNFKLIAFFHYGINRGMSRGTLD